MKDRSKTACGLTSLPPQKSWHQMRQCHLCCVQWRTDRWDARPNTAADRLLGHKLCSVREQILNIQYIAHELFCKSWQLRSADLQHPQKVKCILKPISELQNIVQNNPESEEIYMAHWTFDIYMVHWVLDSWYEKENSATAKTSWKWGIIRSFSVDAKANHTLWHTRLSIHKQLYSDYMLKLFRPWQNKENLHDTNKSSANHFMTPVLSGKNNYQK